MLLPGTLLQSTSCFRCCLTVQIKCLIVSVWVTQSWITVDLWSTGLSAVSLQSPFNYRTRKLGKRVISTLNAMKVCSLLACTLEQLTVACWFSWATAFTGLGHCEMTAVCSVFFSFLFTKEFGSFTWKAKVCLISPEMSSSNLQMWHIFLGSWMHQT